jgi:hypothetical protein
VHERVPVADVQPGHLLEPRQTLFVNRFREQCPLREVTIERGLPDARALRYAVQGHGRAVCAQQVDKRVDERLTVALGVAPWPGTWRVQAGSPPWVRINGQ